MDFVWAADIHGPKSPHFRGLVNFSPYLTIHYPCTQPKIKIQRKLLLSYFKSIVLLSFERISGTGNSFSYHEISKSANEITIIKSSFNQKLNQHAYFEKSTLGGNKYLTFYKVTIVHNFC